jgi:formylglycine-generating enzyme
VNRSPQNYTPIDLQGPPEFPPMWADAWGDDRYGLYVEITLGDATQRFRWIEPGRFQMGSPANEHMRQDNETQHWVHLTQGFWMADTACTQAFWAAVLGDDRPSQFSGDALPVESVSWNRCLEFTQAVTMGLRARLSGLPEDFKLLDFEAMLPTEAQWEYACRAGTQTPFSTGRSISTEQANFDGNFPYLDSDRTGSYVTRTVPVKSFDPNPWGLYEVHGNVWEWCFDGLRTFDKQSQVDPGDPLVTVSEVSTASAARAPRGAAPLNRVLRP